VGFGWGLRRRAAHALAVVEAVRVRILREPSVEVTAAALQAQLGCWFVSQEEARAFALQWPAEVVLREADRCVHHEFEMLGTDSQAGSGALPWHQDVRSRRTWPLHYHKRLRYDLTGVRGSDVKIPWELSRFQHLVPLAKGYLLSGNEVYAKAAAADIADWLEQNPFRYGVNWTCAMEVAIRACNWLWARWAFEGAPSWPAEFQRAGVASLWQHAWYIEHNLEDHGGNRSNHYLADIVGLLFIAVMFPTLPRASIRRIFAVRELARCMDEMVYPDGVSFENSTSYQRLVMELFTASAVLCRRNGIDLPGTFWERLERMFGFIDACTRPDGRLPMVGDADDGRLFALDGYCVWDRWDFRSLLSVGAVLFRRVDFKRTAGQRHEAVDWLLGAKGIAVWEAL
jgi:heparinase II/III-like protein